MKFNGRLSPIEDVKNRSRQGKSLHFLMLVPDFYPEGGAVGRATHMMTLGLRAQGATVSVVARWRLASAGTASSETSGFRAFGTFCRAPGSVPSRWRSLISGCGFALGCAYSLLRTDYDGVLVYGLSPFYFPVAVVAKMKSCPMAFLQYDLYEPVNSDPLWKRRSARFYRFTERFLARNAQILALSESDDLVAKFAVLAPDVPAFRNWPPTDFSFFLDGSGSRGRIAFGIASDVPLIVYAGTISRLEGVDVLIEAMVLVIKAFPKATLAIAGLVGGDAFEGTPPDYHAMPGQLGITANVKFLGLIDRAAIRDLLAASTCAVMPKRDHPGNSAASPIKLGEYLASGSPVVASKVCGIERWLLDGRDVLLTEPGSVESLALAILKVLRNPVFGRSVGYSGRAVGREHCDYICWGSSFLTAWSRCISICGSV